jgi:23S rRNA (guanosine2251-2'-O)-methyltransferase
MRKVVGHHSCEEVFKVRPKAIRSVLIKRDYQNSDHLVDFYSRAKQLKLHVKLVSPQELDKICEGHQGICLELEESPELNFKELEKKENALIIALDGVEDPQNLGNILRTAWLMGADGILITQNRAVGLTPTVCKIASGGAEYVPVESYNQIIQGIEKLKEIGFWVYGLAEKAQKPIFSIEMAKKTVLVAGSEMKGMKPQTLKACDELVKIPQTDEVASLNVATSVALGSYEYLRQISL